MGRQPYVVLAPLMIDRIAMMEAIIAASPEFAPTFSEFVDEWANEPELPYYLALADYSRHLIQLLEAKACDGLQAAFKTIESLIASGDDYVRTAGVIGILENLQNTNLHSVTEPNRFLEFLGPTSLKYWDKVADFWENGTVITDD